MCVFIKPAVNTKLRGITNTMDDAIPIQKGLDRLELYVESNKKKFNKGKSKYCNSIFKKFPCPTVCC